MNRAKRAVFLQLALVSLCLLAILFSLFHERIVVKYIVHHYELPYFGISLMHELDLHTGKDNDSVIRSFELSRDVTVYSMTEDGMLLYPEEISPALRVTLLQLRERIIQQGKEIVFTVENEKDMLIWGSFDRLAGRFLFVKQSAVVIDSFYRHRILRSSILMFGIFFFIIAGAIIIFRSVVRSADETITRTNKAIIRLQAVAESQVRMLRKTQVFMERSGALLQERDPLDLVGEGLRNHGHYLGEMRIMFHNALLLPDSSKPKEVFPLQRVCTAAQDMIADPAADAGVMVKLIELNPDLTIEGHEGLLLLALDDLLSRLVSRVSPGVCINLVISGIPDSVSLDISVQEPEIDLDPSGIYFSGYLFELMDVQLNFITGRDSTFAIHMEFHGSGV